MAVDPGTRLGVFEIVNLLGVGGMGEVYRARDTKLGREVAIKVLPEEVAADAERLARFEREAKLLASLNHARIATLHGFEREGDTHFLVMELVDGRTLEEVIAGRPMPFEDARPIFIQVAEALEAAHERGIVHRDLKPANIKITPNGEAKLLDFGIAKAFVSESERPSIGSNDTTLPSTPTPRTNLTDELVVVGTPSYMSPEQTRGKRVDKRTDIWAFGCCLYQVLTGAKAFEGETVADVVGSITRGEPDFSALPADTPASVRRLLERCLRKDSNQRLRDIGDARIDLADTEADGVVIAGSGPQSGRKPAAARLLTAGIAAGIAICAVVAYVFFGTHANFSLSPGGEQDGFSTAPAKEVRRYPLALPPEMPHATPVLYDQPVAISPDGQTIVYRAEAQGDVMLVRHRINELGFEPVTGTEGGAFYPIFSPDGKWLAFFSGQVLCKMPATGGNPTRLTNAIIIGTPFWANDGYIYFSQTLQSGICRIKATGGPVEPLTALRDGEVVHAWPNVTPDGRYLLYAGFTAFGTENANLYAHDLKTGEETMLVERLGAGMYLPTGHLGYVQGDTIYVRCINWDTLEFLGPPVDVTPERLVSPGKIPTRFRFSPNGTLVYVPERSTTVREFAWIDMAGNEEPSGMPPGEYLWGRISPDGTRIAYATRTGSEADVWAYDLALGTSSRYTHSDDSEDFPTWAPDGEHLFFSAQGRDQSSIKWVALATGEIETLAVSPDLMRAHTFAGDGNTLLFEIVRLSGPDVEALNLQDGTIKPILNSTYAERNPVVSPDGNWLAYNADETGGMEVFVVSYPDTKRKIRISPDGGQWPLWSPDGTKLYYRGKDGIMVVDITREPNFSAGRARALVPVPSEAYGATYDSWRFYDLSPDGTRFLIPKRVESGDTTNEIIVVENWFEEVKRLAPLGDAP